MKSIYFIVTVAIISLFITGCGDDRSHGIDKLTKSGIEQSWIYESGQGNIMVENNFVYIPGGFDVDGDGLTESGFWLSVYEAKEDNTTSKNIDLSDITNIQNFIRENFWVYNPNDEYKRFNKSLPLDNGYTNSPASDLSISQVIFNDTGKTVRNISPLESAISLKSSQIEGGYEILLPSEKQWMHLVKLVINNPKNWTSKELGKGQLYQGDRDGTDNRRTFVIENSILGEDSNVPKDYAVDVYDLSGGVAEWTSGMVAIGDRFLTGDSGKNEYNAINNIPSWWKPILEGQSASLGQMEGAGQYHDGSSLAGTTDTIIVNSDGTKGNVDDYAVVARGGSNSIDDKTLVGISAAKLDYGVGFQDPTVGFRASTAYLY